MADQHQRLIPLQGAFNFRDLGGYRGFDGRSVKWRSLFRADGLFRLSDEDLEQLRQLRIATVIDLRTPGELEKYPRVEVFHPGLGFHHLPMLDVLPPDDDMDRWTDPAYVADEYRRMFAAGQEAIRSSLELLLDPASYPLAYHCMAGKDRTGILSALTLELLGVDRQEILADYAMSGAGMQRMIDWTRQNRPELVEQADLTAAAWIAAEPESMASFLQTLDNEYGGVERWASSVGLDDASERLGRILLE